MDGGGWTTDGSASRITPRTLPYAVRSTGTTQHGWADGCRLHVFIALEGGERARDNGTLLCVCVLNIKPLFLLVDIQHTPCPR